MKKTIPTSIARTLFYVEEDAYLKLDAYLTEVRAYFATYEDSKDIIDDIESRIQEQLLELSTQDKSDRIVTEAHIDTLIKTMGRPQEFEGEQAKEDSSSSEPHTNRKLYRDRENAIIGGVASGLATYFGIDPIIVRALFFISIFFGGFGIIAYIFLWFAVPEAKTPTQKLEMEGISVTLEKVKKLVEEKIEEVKSDGGLKKKTEKVRSAIFDAAQFFLRTFGKIIGLVCKIIAVAGTAALVTILLIVIIDSPFTIPNIGATLHYMLIGTIFLLAIIPVIFIGLIGGLLADKKKKTHKTLAGVLGIVWILACITGAVLVFHVVKNKEMQRDTLPQEIQYE
jgi:phage shock protein PspC (stress-responsive transcriptional regulator)